MVFCEAPLDAAALGMGTSAPAATKGAGCGANKKREEEEDVVRVRSAAPPVTEARTRGPEEPVDASSFGGLQCLQTIVFRID
ncbi:unnamed protein product [Miscanthus lutarioriparius]|uniref:Uncharacterized protein n=1 Tax=Miscanthus lutarioriparius TaxID=422564 RepID=A0A811PIE3_9POAL|nr:unnamed protein product [Miscanthus lutarioriparius]